MTKLTSTEIKIKVDSISQAAWDLIARELKELNTDPRARWLILGRIISGLFSCHYQLSINGSLEAEKEVLEKAAASNA